MLRSFLVSLLLWGCQSGPSAEPSPKPSTPASAEPGGPSPSEASATQNANEPSTAPAWVTDKRPEQRELERIYAGTYDENFACYSVTSSAKGLVVSMTSAEDVDLNVRDPHICGATNGLAFLGPAKELVAEFPRGGDPTCYVKIETKDGKLGLTESWPKRCWTYFCGMRGTPGWVSVSARHQKAPPCHEHPG